MSHPPTSPSAGQPPDVQHLADRALSDLSVRHGEWSEAARQDAVESMRRLSRWHLVRRGCRVPLYELYVVGMKRGAEAAARRFVEEAAAPTAEWLGLNPAELLLSGKGCIVPLELARAQTDLVILQGLFEPTVEFIQRFEAEVSERLEALYAEQVRPHLSQTLSAVTRAWAGKPAE